MTPVSPKDVLTYSKSRKAWFVGDRELSKGEYDKLVADANLIVNTQLWKLVILQSKYYAQVRAIEEENNLAAREYHKAVRTIEDFIKGLLK